MFRIFAELISWKLGGNRLSVIDICQILSLILQSKQCTTHRCHFSEQFISSACSPYKRIGFYAHLYSLTNVLVVWTYLNWIGHTIFLPYFIVDSSLDPLWMRSMFHLRSSYSITSPLSLSSSDIMLDSYYCLPDNLMIWWWLQWWN